MIDELKKLAIAAIAYAGPFDDPRIGWIGSQPSNPELFKCERCGREHLDCFKIVHTDTCSAKAFIDAMQAARNIVHG